MSRAWRLGNSVKLAQKEKRCPVNAALESQNGKLLISGKVGVIFLFFFIDRLLKALFTAMAELVRFTITVNARI